jgi:hypothetical protein
MGKGISFLYAGAWYKGIVEGRKSTRQPSISVIASESISIVRIVPSRLVNPENAAAQHPTVVAELFGPVETGNLNCTRAP